MDQKIKMLDYQASNLRYAKKNPYENAVLNHLNRTGHIWERQKIWGFRIFDFWCDLLGIAVEVDGDSHDPVKDAQKDNVFMLADAIIVLRIKNGNGKDLDSALDAIRKSDLWRDRRKAKGLPRPLVIHFPKPKTKKVTRLQASRLGSAEHILRQNGIKPTPEDVAVAQKIGCNNFIRDRHPDIWRQIQVAKQDLERISRQKKKMKRRNRRSRRRHR